MKREHFIHLVEEVLDSIPTEFRQRMQNLVVLVGDRPTSHKRPHRPAEKIGPRKSRSLLMGVFQGVPATQKSVFDLCPGPTRIVLYQKNIEEVCRNEAEIHHEVRRTVLHELGHYFGMGESQLKDV
ncbi:MAG TPA: metallopeptidase family protein [Candidatus Sulfotelmatobacter sp.]|nr:metallopeptidase family protein [Candidatus Sulfotelmatobacter sp.]